MTTIADLPQEQELVERAKRQDTEAFCVLYRHYLPHLHDYIAYRVGHKQDTEDIVATVFTRVVESLTQFEYRQKGSFAAWLFTIAYREVAAFYRKHQRTGMNISLDELPDIRHNTLSPEQMVARREQFMQLYLLIQTLSDKRQEILVMRFFGGLRNKDIATVLDLNPQTISSHLCQALEDLRNKYQGLLEKGVEV